MLTTPIAWCEANPGGMFFECESHMSKSWVYHSLRYSRDCSTRSSIWYLCPSLAYAEMMSNEG